MYDVAIIGGGIVGLATARALAIARPDLKLVLFEKERDVALHQTGRNSGVIHSGVYYRPGSKKALLCRRGKLALERFCAERGVRFERCGKVIVATTEEERSRLHEIHRRAGENGVSASLIGPERLREIEPHAAGIEALHVPETGIVDYVEVSRELLAIARSRGVEVVLGARVEALREVGGEAVVETSVGVYPARTLVNCAGLHSDRIARLAGAEGDERILPFRGEYYRLRAEVEHLVRHLIYPVPDPAFPFLGVHFTRMIQGGVECGPNGVLAFAREGYEKRDVSLRDLTETLAFPGFWRLAARHLGTGIAELRRSYSRRIFARDLARLVPEVREKDLLPAPAGVRAQAVTSAGQLVDDFVIRRTARMVHVVNAPSPAATASLAIGEEIAGLIA